jgi:3-methyladenine DNA glycosylase AlkC
MAAFKDEFSPELVRALARELSAAWPEFPRRRFTDRAGAALEPLELMARVELLSDRLAGTLPGDFGAAAAILWRALDSPTFTGWMTLPCGTYVARVGIDDPDVALPLFAGLSPRFSSEGPIRPFIERRPKLTYEYLQRWTTDPDEHVRRLVSEGTRPRLPWAPLLRGLIADPSPNLPLLEALVDDPSEYVRRSVANHLNDIAKDHPDVALDLARRWIARGEPGAWVVRHRLRTLVKRGDPAALEILGVDGGAEIVLYDLRLEPERLVIGRTVSFSFTLVLAGNQPAEAIIDYRVHYVGANGLRRPKVFKLTRRRLQPDEPVTITRAHRFANVSIRQLRPGPHTIDVQVNGRVLASAGLEVVEPPAEA